MGNGDLSTDLGLGALTPAAAVSAADAKPSPRDREDSTRRQRQIAPNPGTQKSADSECQNENQNEDQNEDEAESLEIFDNAAHQLDRLA